MRILGEKITLCALIGIFNAKIKSESFDADKEMFKLVLTSSSDNQMYRSFMYYCNYEEDVCSESHAEMLEKADELETIDVV